MNIGQLSSAMQALRAPAAAKPVAGAEALSGVGPNAGGFSQLLSKALEGSSQAQTQASELQQKFQMGDPAVSLEQTMVAMQKSQIALQATVTVRNRLVSAYTDIMNMPV
jgi:flagellar hook-basal body complex protein FliE